MTRFSKTMLGRIRTVAFGALAAGGLAGMAGLAGCAQQGVSCTASHGAFAVELTVTSNPDSCPTIPGGVWGLATYNAEVNGRPDFDDASVAIQYEELVDQIWEAEARLGEVVADGPTYSLGSFAEPEPVKGVCTLPTLSPVSQNIPTLPAIPAVEDDPETEDVDESEPAVPAVPARTLGETWTNLRLWVSAANQGTRFVGNVAMTEDDCTVEYEAVGLWPAVDCAGAEGPEDGYCSSVPLPELGMVVGSGIGPDLKTHCHPELMLCVLDEKPSAD